MIYMKKFYFAILSVLLFAVTGFAQTQTITYNNGGTYQWTPPCGVTSFSVQAWGAGAGGYSWQGGGGGGGGGGAYAASTNIPVIYGNTYTIVVGQGASRGSGEAGGTTSFGGNLVKAEGGGIASITTGGRSTGTYSVGQIRYAGGNGGGSTSANEGAGGGGSAGASGPGGNGYPPSGNSGGAGGLGGPGGGAAGGQGGKKYSDGDDGSSPGAGGGERGSGRYSQDGGGADGQVIITYNGIGNYCNVSFSYTEPITNVNFAGINNSTSASTGSSDYELFCITGKVSIGTSYPISLQGNTVGWYRDYFTVWIDWNQNGIFDASEKTNIGSIFNSTGIDGITATGSIAVPAGATLGTTKMRVVKNYNGYSGSACGSNTYGQAEDYLITVSGNCQQPTGATGNGTASALTVCSGTPVTLKQTGGTLGPSQQWKWYSGTPGGTLVNANTNSDAAYSFTASAGTTYYVRAEGGTCGTTGAYKSVAVTVNTVGILAVTSGSKDFSVCSGVNSGPYAVFTFGGGATNVTFSGLPPGLSATKSGNQYTISGSTTVTGTINYTATLTGNDPCTNPDPISGTITVNQAPATFSYTSSPVTYCTNALITPNVANTTGGTPTAYAVIGTPLPAGLSLDASGNITGTPSTAMPAANYTIRASNSCGYKDATVNITISNGNAVFNITPNGTQNVCSNFGGIVIGLNGSESGVSYRLYRNGALVGSQTGTGSAFDFGNQPTAGTYTVRTTTGCATNMNGSTVINITQQPTATFTYSSYTYCRQGVSGAANLSGSPLTGTFSASPGLVFVDNTTGVIDLAASTPNNYSITYTIAASGGCGVYTYPNPTPIKINTAPAVFTVFGTGSYCAGTGGIPVNMDGSQTGVNYQLYLNGSAIGGVKAGTGSALSFGNQTAGGTYTVKAMNGCITDMDGSATITVNPLPSPIIINPAAATICQGTIVPLSASVNPPVSSSSFVNIPSGNINVNIPDNNPTGISSLLKVTGIPSGATITSVVVTFNVTHTYDGDLLINLKGPNGNVLNLANGIGGSRNGFTNTQVASDASGNIQSATSTVYNGYYLPQGDIGVIGAKVVTSNVSNGSTFSQLYGASATSANGDWTFSVKEKTKKYFWLLGNRSNKINQYYTPYPVSVTLSAATDLFTDPGATVPYVAGTSTSTVYAKPSAYSPPAFTYTATSTNSYGCSTTATSVLTVSRSPKLTLTSDYCSTPGKVTVTATSDIAINNWQWSDGSTGTIYGNSSYIQPNNAGTYYVTAKSTANSCTSTGSMSVAQELVTNGDFEQGNTGFTSGYTNDQSANGLYTPEGKYAVNNNPQFNHC